MEIMVGNGVFLEMRPLWECMVALGLGVLVGLEREQARAEFAADHSQSLTNAGVHAKGTRTFSLISLLGYSSALLGESFPVMPLLALLALALLLSVLHLKKPGQVLSQTGERDRSVESPQEGEDITTEVAALLVAVIGMLVRLHTGVAVMLGLMCTVVLFAKPWTRQLASRVQRGELLGTLQLLVAVAILLPLVPNRPLNLFPPLDGVLNPRSIVLFVLLIAAVSYIGYILTRILGARRGLSLAGFIGGMSSSTAVTLAMAERARQSPTLLLAAAQAATLACAVMMPRVLLVTMVVYPPLGSWLLWPALANSLGYVLVYGLLAWRRKENDLEDAEKKALKLQNPFELGPALKLGALYVVVVLVAKVARVYLGVRGFYLAAAMSGLADVDSITVTAARLAHHGQESLGVGVTAILVAAATNTVAKSGMALWSGGRRYGMLVLLGHVVAFSFGAVAWLAAVFRHW